MIYATLSYWAVMLLKTLENRRVQTGQVSFLANRRIQPLCHLSGVYFQQLTTEPEMLW
jgi:hypothetical protein